jgi:hypothetical protein
MSKTIGLIIENIPVGCNAYNACIVGCNSSKHAIIKGSKNTRYTLFYVIKAS